MEKEQIPHCLCWIIDIYFVYYNIITKKEEENEENFTSSISLAWTTNTSTN